MELGVLQLLSHINNELNGGLSCYEFDYFFGLKPIKNSIRSLGLNQTTPVRFSLHLSMPHSAHNPKGHWTSQHPESNYLQSK
jgi:hypothetical protein